MEVAINERIKKIIDQLRDQEKIYVFCDKYEYEDICIENTEANDMSSQIEKV